MVGAPVVQLPTRLSAYRGVHRYPYSFVAIRETAVDVDQ
jgi:hypothetical protein